MLSMTYMHFKLKVENKFYHYLSNMYLRYVHFKLRVENKLYHDQSNMYSILKNSINDSSHLTKHDQLTFFVHVYFGPIRNADSGCTCNSTIFAFFCYTDTCQY
jgi:hypothetical protein